MNAKSSLFRCIALAFLLSVTSEHAAVVFDNSNATPPAFGDVNVGQWFAQSFVVDANNYTSVSVVLDMGTAVNSSGNFFVSIYSNAGNNTPLSELALLTGEPNPATAGTHDYSGAVALTANATYWVVAGVSSGSGSYRWGDELGGSIETGSTVGFSRSAGSGEPWDAPSTLLAFNMQVSAVPEPVNVALGVFGLLLGGVKSFRWWNSRRRQLVPSL